MSSSRKRAISSCVPCYTRKQKVASPSSQAPEVSHELNDPSATGNRHAANVLGDNALTTVSITLQRQTKLLAPVLVPTLEEGREPETEPETQQAASH